MSFFCCFFIYYVILYMAEGLDSYNKGAYAGFSSLGRVMEGDVSGQKESPMQIPLACPTNEAANLSLVVSRVWEYLLLLYFSGHPPGLY